ncbi:MAG TPA: DUF2169 domain-containing protein [Longimicrobiaceae bacterium]|nr:DUF2169 domain-containing protein [Longimicrobiaceae bacterium]
MLQLVNDTGLAATIFAAPNPDGVESLYTVVKGTFALDRLDAWGIPARADEQVPPVLADEHHGDPAATSIRVPSDVSLMKPGTDVLLVGSAYAPGGRPATWMDVALTAGPLHRTVRVFGDRVWRAGATATPSSPQPFERMPLVWERAFGGTDRAGDALRGEARNPVGAGFRAPDGEKPLDGLPLPNLEDPADPIVAWSQLPAPAGFAPLSPHWLPRRAWAGTYDDAWQSGRAPYLPADFDPRFFQLAPEGLVAPGWFQGGEVVSVSGATPDGRLLFRLPSLPVQVEYRLDGGAESPAVRLDTVLIEPDASRVVLVWRTVLACDKKLLKVREIAVRAE